MNMSQLKNDVGNSANNNTSTTIPSLKRTLSGGTANSNSPHVTSHPVGLGPGPMPIPSVMHASAATQPPQILRAVTSSGVFSRQPVGGSGNGGGYGSRMSLGPNPSGPPSSTSSLSTTRSISQSSQDWRMHLTIEERQAVRSRIRDAYTNRCTTYEDLLQTVAAIEEELLHISAPSRLDYFKSGFEFENRVKLKKDQLQGQLGNATGSSSSGGGSSTSSMNDSAKRRLNSSPTSMNSVSSHNNHHPGAPGSHSGGKKPTETSPYKKQRS